MAAIKWDSTLTVIGILWIVIIILNQIFDPTLSSIFGVMLAFAFAIYGFDPNRRYRLERTKNRLNSLVLATGGFLVLTLVSNFVFPLIDKTLKGITITKTLSLMSEARATIYFSQINPALVGNLPINFGTFGWIIPFIETIWLAIFFEFVLDRTKIEPRFNNSILYVIIALITSVFTTLHFSVLGVTNGIALANVALFTVITLILIIVEKQMLAAILFHVIANSFALAWSGELAPVFNAISPLAVTAIVVIGAMFIFTSKPIRKIFSAVT